MESLWDRNHENGTDKDLQPLAGLIPLHAAKSIVGSHGIQPLSAQKLLRHFDHAVAGGDEDAVAFLVVDDRAAGEGTE